MLEKLCRTWEISHLVFEKDTDAYARDRDEKIIEMAREVGVKVISRVGRTLYDPDELVKANGGKPTMSITQVQNVRNQVKLRRILQGNCSLNSGGQEIASYSTTDTSAYESS